MIPDLVRNTGDGRVVADVPPLPAEELDAHALSAPPMTGAEYLTSSVLQALWDAIAATFRLELSDRIYRFRTFRGYFPPSDWKPIDICFP